jgi:biopolymer transport protein ExbB/TolQ
MLDMLLNFIEESSSITLFVIGLLGVYFIALNWLFAMRFLTLKKLIQSETMALDSLFQKKEKISKFSLIFQYIISRKDDLNNVSENILKLIKHTITREATRGLIFFSIVASTSPFIGLFGTVVSILDTFSTLGDAELGAISVIAQGVSEALVATAIGIFVATFAYSYHQILKRKAYELVELITMQNEIILSGKGE